MKLRRDSERRVVYIKQHCPKCGELMRRVDLKKHMKQCKGIKRET